MKTRFFPLILLLCFLAQGFAQAAQGADEEWSYQWFSVVAPSDQDSFWLKRGNGRTEVRDDGVLIATQDQEYLLYVITQEASSGAWDGTVSQVIEFSARAVQIDGQYTEAAHLTVSGGGRCAAVRISGEEFQEYRLEWTNGNARLWVDGVDRPELLKLISIAPDHPYANSLSFGDESASAGGESLWRYIRWKPMEL